MGDAVQYVAGTMPVAVPHHPNRANVGPEQFVRIAPLAVGRDDEEVGITVNAFECQDDADNMKGDTRAARGLVPIPIRRGRFAPDRSGRFRYPGKHGC